ENSLSTRQIFQALNDVTDRAERADGKHVLSCLVCFFVEGVDIRSLWPFRGRPDRCKSADAAAPGGIILNAIDRGIQLSLINSELLERAHATTGANDCDQIARPHLLINKLL